VAPNSSLKLLLPGACLCSGLGKGGQQMQSCRKAYVSALQLLVQLANLQTAFLTLDNALKVTNRRVNALENVVKPKLENTISYIKVRGWVLVALVALLVALQGLVALASAAERSRPSAAGQLPVLQAVTAAAAAAAVWASSCCREACWCTMPCLEAAAAAASLH
jgi:hypothetical protein